MRRTTLPPVTVAFAAALLLAGCGSQNGGDAGSGKVSPSPSRTPAPSTSTSGGCVKEARLTAADNHRTLCLTEGGQVRISLDGTKERAWTPVKASGGGTLEAVNAGIVVRAGDAEAAYRAAATGTAELTANRPMCASPTSPGQVSCLGIQEWSVTVRVR